ncbi:MAG: sigma-70 family RNA polymerase sigma factor [Thermomicrobiales bacterium]
MTDARSLDARFEAHRPHLIAVATRLLGSATEAEDAVQEAWIRLDRAGDEGIANFGGWLTTVVSRICLDHLRTRSSRAEEPVDEGADDPAAGEPGPEDTAILGEATAEALAVVLETLTPIERVAFVLHDVFDVPFEEIAAVVDRTPAATRQIASRARKRVRVGTPRTRTSSTAQREIVAAFFTASREGRLHDLIQLLAPGVVLRSDLAAVRMGSAPEVQGASAVAEVFSGRARAARMATIDGLAGMVWAPGGNPRVVFRFTVEGDAIVGIELIAEETTISGMTVVPDHPAVLRKAPDAFSGAGES